jgi:tRNA pseudouridine55 synthase
VEGFLCIDKPCGPSSFSVVAKVKRLFRTAKVGHAGTLDPAASGLLIIALGTATRLLPYLSIEPKRYRFGIRFGVTTDTLDAQGTVVRSGGSIPSMAAIESALPGFTGTIQQAPPEYSAIKIGGERAYRLAREGRAVAMPLRPVTIGAFALLHYDPDAGRAAFEIRCSGGTYVRSLARDLAARLGTFGHAFEIRRLAAGPFTVETAVGLETLEKSNDATEHLLPVEKVFAGMPSAVIDEQQLAIIETGRDLSLTIDKTEGAGDPEIAFAYDEAHHLRAVMRHKEAGVYHPEKVFLKKDE